MIDWDLEAPGLHRYFYPFLDDPSLERTEGLLELLWDFVTTVQTPLAERVGSLADPARMADVSRVAVPIRFEFAGEGQLHLIGAGRQDNAYADRLYKFEWQTFYERFGGAEFISNLMVSAREDYDFILVDSRTGVADTAGICTIQIPDKIVLLFTYNRQSVEGTAAIGRALRDVRPELPVLLRPMRVVRDVEGLTEAREFARSMLGAFLPTLSEEEDDAYWQRIEVPHYHAYAFEEMLAVLRDVAGGRNTLLSDMEVLTSDLAGGAPIRAPKLERGARERLLRQCRLRDPRQVAMADAMELEPSSALKRLMDLAAETRRHYRWDHAWISQIAEVANELAAKLGGLGRHQEAEAAAEEAVELFRIVSADRPDTCLPKLAMSLRNFGVTLSALGRREEALAASEEAVEIYRRLAADRPDTYLPDLARSISVLSDALAGLDRAGDAAKAASEALTLLVPFIERYPDSFGPLGHDVQKDVLDYSNAAGLEPEKALLERVERALARAAPGL
jgi:hypothetical protein